MIPDVGVAEVGGFHGAAAVVVTVGLAIAIVKAAAAVEVMAVNDPVLPFRLIVHGGAVRIVEHDGVPRQDRLAAVVLADRTAAAERSEALLDRAQRRLVQHEIDAERPRDGRGRPS